MFACHMFQFSLFFVSEPSDTKKMSSSTDNYLEAASVFIKRIRDLVMSACSMFAFLFVRSVVLGLQWFTWGVTGVVETKRNIKQGVAYKQSAHILDIMWRRKLHMHLSADPGNFILLHKQFKHPSYILKTNVSLYCITKTDAYFVETPDKLNVYSSDTSPFLYHAQFLHATKIIVVPHASFHKITTEIGTPQKTSIFISSTGRCGASVLIKMFENIPATLCISEPDCYTNIDALVRTQKITRGEYDQFVQSCTRFLYKADDRVNVVCVKMRPMNVKIIEDICILVPTVRHIFLYRNSLKTILSSLNALCSGTGFNVARIIIDNRILSTIMPCVRNTIYDWLIRMDPDDVQIKDMLTSLSLVGMLTAQWASIVNKTLEYKDRGIPIIAILYEDMMRNPKHCMELLCDLLHMKRGSVFHAVETIKKDVSKFGPALNKTSLMKDTCRDMISNKRRTEADKILKKYGLAHLGERVDMTGLLKISSS